ncbi:Rap1a/Tai family immunity protein [Shewanella phaeophyticola]|uniref:Rap1a/Tai family immunity protein n=1 Tax=Shewanella phaeophyticola TaxID=2978345 RepID=A0ABT2P2A8_9GAMM|nr:Rap1a/Tai family immunity protein [Shewanella sp. KJ10-1]MCT8986788.1 Rap1a/Tai family immunity protein [Shewanella sp. KJ10-1]
MVFAFLAVKLLSAPPAKAIEVLTAQELSSHCALFHSEPESADGQYCVRYIQGFIDGAIATDARVMLNAESALESKETFSERAIRTRMPNRLDRSRAAGLAGFCLGDPLLLRDVANVIVADLIAQTDSSEGNEPAMEVVYQSLLKNYPCKL